MSGGTKFDYASDYAKYRPKDDDKFSSYVDKYPDLTAAWKRIEDDPSHADSQYWIKRGATSKSAFGRAHAAEDQALKTGRYQGDTDVVPYDDPTRFTTWSEETVPTVGPISGGGKPGDPNYPISIVDYTPPSAMSGIPLEYQPWLQPENISDSLWNYQAPELTPWKGRGVDWGWAQKPAVQYGQQPTSQTNEEQNNEQQGSMDWYMDPANPMGHYAALKRSGSIDYGQDPLTGNWIYKAGGFPENALDYDPANITPAYGDEGFDTNVTPGWS